jgi:hypothetical protein
MKYFFVTANSLNLDQTPGISESGPDPNYLHTQLRLRSVIKNMKTFTDILYSFVAPCLKSNVSVFRSDTSSKMTFKFYFDDFRNPTYGIDKTDFYRKTMVIIN